MKLVFKSSAFALIAGALVIVFTAASPVDPTTATIQANRINGSVTGGAIPYTDPVFTTMVSDIQAGNYQAAVTAAVNSTYFPYYLPRRLAKQMQNNKNSEAGIPDNDAVAFIVANLLGLGGTQPSIGAIWTQNATYCVDTTKPNVKIELSQSVANGACGANQIHMFWAGDPLAWDWSNILVKVPKQVVRQHVADPYTQQAAPLVSLQQKDVGGYMTLADTFVPDDSVQTSYNDFASFAFTGGTNLRGIEYFYEIAFGVTLASMENTQGVTADMTPKFIPSNNPNFLVGQNQPACIACHGGGASSRLHGYAVFADVFDFNVDHIGLVYNASPSYSASSSDLGKSYGSNTDQGTRAAVQTCADQTNFVCNPNSPGVDQGQGWDLTYWQSVGLLSRWGWKGPITGKGLNALASSVVQASGVYTNMVQRVIGEICPTGAISQSQISSIASAAMAKESAALSSSTHVAPDQGAFGYIVIQVASDPSCI